jgi:hypothetical protein
MLKRFMGAGADFHVARKGEQCPLIGQVPLFLLKKEFVMNLPGIRGSRSLLPFP